MLSKAKRGQVMAEYLLLLLFVASALLVSRVQVKNASDEPQYLMQAAGEALSRWLNDVIFILCLPS